MSSLEPAGQDIFSVSDNIKGLARQGAHSEHVPNDVSLQAINPCFLLLCPRPMRPVESQDGFAKGVNQGVPARQGGLQRTRLDIGKDRAPDFVDAGFPIFGDR